MSDIVWVAFISAGGALTAAVIAQLLAVRVANRSADRTDQREALQWQRNEARRLDDIQRMELQREQELLDVRLRELWGHVLTARWQMQDALERWLACQGDDDQVTAKVSAEQLPCTAAAQAYAVALTGVAAVRPSARTFYVATAQLQLALQGSDARRMSTAAEVWNASFEVLEQAVGNLDCSPRGQR